jgi:phage gp29-like protein
LTSDVGSSGSQALGNVHNEIRLDVVDRVGKYTAKILKGSIIKSMLILNYGDDSEMPSVTIKTKRSKDMKGLAETAKILMETYPDIPRSIEQIKETHGIATPASEEDTLRTSTPTGEPDGTQGDPEAGSLLPHETKASHVVVRAAEAKANVDKLADNVMESLTGVASQWLGGVKPAFDRLAALAISDNVTDDDFLATVELAKEQLPELFTELNTEVLQKAFEDSSGTALMAGVEDSLNI